jgi:hypothetical protein
MRRVLMMNRLRSGRVTSMALLAATLAALLLPRGSATMRQDGDRPSGMAYETRHIEGWTVRVNADFLQRQPSLADRALNLLGTQLRQVVRVVPPAAVEKLRSIRIWVEEKEPHHPCMTYHPSAQWLREHGMSPEKAKCVEIANVRNFLNWSRDQKWMVLHELSHGYHDQFIADGFENGDVKDAYDRAMKSGLYDSVAKIVGGRQKAYAASNHEEYFAEISEAYFGLNDFYPFDRKDLRRHDPAGYDMVERLWGVSPGSPDPP